MKKRVLICDDDEGILEAVTIVLKEQGYEVAALTNGEEIYTTIEAFKPDLILLDLWMPAMDGREIAKQLKANTKTHDIPIIVVSASKDTLWVSREIGADDSLCKPFDIQELEAKVASLLG